MSTEVRMLNKVICYIEGGYYKTINQQHSSAAERESYTQQPRSCWTTSEIRQWQWQWQEQEQQPTSSSATQIAVITQQPQSFLSEAERALDQAINQQHSSTAQRAIVTQQPRSFWTASEIRQWQEQAMNQQQPILSNEPEWQTMPQQQSIFLNPSNLGLYHAGVLQSPVMLNSSDIEPYQTGALQQLVLFAESEIERDQTVNQGESIFFTGEIVPQQPPIFFNESERRQDQVIAQQPQSSLHEPEVNIVIDRQYYK